MGTDPVRQRWSRDTLIPRLSEDKLMLDGTENQKNQSGLHR